MSDLTDRLEALAESWLDDTAPEPHVTELRDLIAAWIAEQDEPDLIVMQLLDLPDGELDVDYHLYREGEFVLVCPRSGCTSTEFYEEDTAVRWHPITVEPEPQADGWTRPTRWEAGIAVEFANVTNENAGLPQVTIHQRRGGDFETTGTICQGCNGRVTMPEWISAEWT